MIVAPVPSDERERLADLRALKILDTPAERRFDRIVELARRIFAVPIAYISLVDADRQWFKSRCGLKPAATPRDISFCGHAILGDEAMVVPDARLDRRFADNPMVAGEPHIRFYAGHPLKGPGGHNVGTLCLVDHQPRELTANDLAILRQLAAMAEHELNVVDLIGVQRELLETKTQLVATRQRLADELAEAAAFLRSLLPAPLAGEVATDYRLVTSSHLGGDLFGYHWVDDRRLAVYLLDVTGHGVSAALLSISVYQAIRRQTLPDTNFDCPGCVLTALNAAFPMEHHGNKFFTIWYGLYDRQTRTLTYANGGHPPPMLFDGTRDDPRLLDHSDLIIGIAPDATYRAHTHPVTRGSRLYLFSDGAYELRDHAGRMLTLDGLRQTFVQAPRDNGSALDHTLHTLQQYQGRPTFDDDVSLLELRFH
jgi:phosphoserine phosphatase RsbU/P